MWLCNVHVQGSFLNHFFALARPFAARADLLTDAAHASPSSVATAAPSGSEVYSLLSRDCGPLVARDRRRTPLRLQRPRPRLRPPHGHPTATPGSSAATAAPSGEELRVGPRPHCHSSVLRLDCGIQGTHIWDLVDVIFFSRVHIMSQRTLCPTVCQ